MASTRQDERQPDTPFDLTILYMEDAMSWCEYLFDIFQPYDVYQNSEEITRFPTHEMTLNNIAESHVVIVIVSPMFVDSCSDQLEHYTEQVVALLCGVEQKDLDAIAEVVPSSREWKLVEALSGQRNITQTTLKLLDGDHSDDEDGVDGDYLTMQGSIGPQPHTTIEEEPEETYLTMSGVLPNKGYPEPEEEDTYLTMHGIVTEEAGGDYITMEGKFEEASEDLYEPMTRNAPPPCDMAGDMTEDTYEVMDKRTIGGGGPRRPPRVMAHGFESPSIGYINTSQGNVQYSKDVYITPTTVKTGDKEPLFIIFTKPTVKSRPEDMYKAIFKSASKELNVVAHAVNMCTLRINSLPIEIVPGPITVEILHNSQTEATLALKVVGPMNIMSQLLQTITNPLEFMCESLKISSADSNGLDNMLYEHCQRHFPPDGFDKLFLTNQQTIQNPSSTNEVPTVLHFAAKYGLKNMCSLLLNCPGAYQAINTRNCNGDTPSVLASKFGDQDLKEYLDNYLEFADSGGGLQHPEEMGSDFVPTDSYVDMAKNQQSNQQYVNKLTGFGGKGNYDRPFPVAIPAARPLLRDDTIKSLVTGNEEDIYDYYDTNKFTFNRTEDNDYDDDDSNAEDYEPLDDQPELSPNRPPQKPPVIEDAEVRVGEGCVKITPNEELEKAPRTNNPDAEIPSEQQALIDIQNQVKNNTLSIEDAVEKFKALEVKAIEAQRRDLSFKAQSAVMREMNEQSKPTKGKGGFRGIFKAKKADTTSPKQALKLPPSATSYKSPPTPPPVVSPKPGVNPKPGVGTTQNVKATTQLPLPISPKPKRTECPNQYHTATSKSVGIYDKPSGRCGQDRYMDGGTLPQLDRFNIPEDQSRNHRPLSNASTMSAGSRSSTVSTGSRDSSYGSGIEEPEADPPPPPARRQGPPDRTKTKNKRFSGKFENEYIDKPLPPIPSRAKASDPVPPRTGRNQMTAAGGDPTGEDLPNRLPPMVPQQGTSRISHRPSDPSSQISTKPTPQPRNKPPRKL